MDTNTALAEKVVHWLKAGRDLASEQAPLLAEEIIRWHYCSAIWLLLIAVSLMGLGYAGYWWIKRNLSTLDFDEDEPVEYAPLFLGFFLGSICFLAGARELIQVVAAPRLVVIQQVSRLVG